MFFSVPHDFGGNNIITGRGLISTYILPLFLSLHPGLVPNQGLGNPEIGDILMGVSVYIYINIEIERVMANGQAVLHLGDSGKIPKSVPSRG